MSENVYQSPKAELGIDDDNAVAISNKDLFFSFQGRIRRGKYWFGTLMLFVALLVVVMVLGLLGLDEGALGAIILVLYIPVIWASFALQVKRWHDRNKSGWWVLISFIPVIGPLWALVENGFLAGDDHANNYGPPCL